MTRPSAGDKIAFGCDGTTRGGSRKNCTMNTTMSHTGTAANHQPARISFAFARRHGPGRLQSVLCEDRDDDQREQQADEAEPAALTMRSMPISFRKPEPMRKKSACLVLRAASGQSDQFRVWAT